jgi:hypothetical protein
VKLALISVKPFSLQDLTLRNSTQPYATPPTPLLILDFKFLIQNLGGQGSASAGKANQG